MCSESDATNDRGFLYDGLMTSVAAFLRAHTLKPNPDWGQHFLADGTVLRTLIESAKLMHTDTVLEIGAGIGVLTKELLAHAGRVIAIEVDRRWIPLLEEYVGEDALRSNRLTVVRGHALKVPYPEERYKIVANIPYHITSHLIRHVFLGVARRPDSLTLLVQKEVAEKICATSRGQPRTMLTILVELFGEPSYVRSVPPGAFLPPPQVDSAVVHVRCLERPRAEGRALDAVFRLASAAFSKKRKMLRASLGKFHGGMELLEMANVSPERRPETLNIQEWVALGRKAVEHR